MTLLVALFALAPHASVEIAVIEIAEIDVQSGAVIRAGWQGASPAGSLIKPFTALAYAATHDYRYPHFICDGHACWLPKGHGRVGIREAVGHSCNSYFAQLTADMRPDDLSIVLRRFGLDPMPASAPRASLYGIGDQWRVAPLDLLRAYVELVSRAEEPGVRELLDGMAMSASGGTSRALGPSMLAKTGTAPCVHRRHAAGDGSGGGSGDGYALALYPRSRPERAVLVRVHGSTGKRAAEALKREIDALGRH